MKLHDRVRYHHLQNLHTEDTLYPEELKELKELEELIHQWDQEVEKASKKQDLEHIKARIEKENQTQITITNALLLHTSGQDRLTIFTNLPGPYGENNLALDFNTPKGKGQDYLNQHFPNIQVETLP